jgi:pantetheine-phosphate adenylyltransferase
MSASEEKSIRQTHICFYVRYKDKKDCNKGETAMTRAIYPGSFDPVTFGHIDIIERASKICDELIVGVLNNSAKQPLFSVGERVSMLEEVISHIPNVKVESFDGLLADYARKTDASLIIRGLRAVTDFEYELQIAQTNRALNENMDTVFFTTNIKYSYLNSTTVKEVAFYGGDVSKFVPPHIIVKLNEKFGRVK